MSICLIIGLEKNDYCILIHSLGNMFVYWYESWNEIYIYCYPECTAKMTNMVKCCQYIGIFVRMNMSKNTHNFRARA